VQNSAIGGTVNEITEWTSVADLKNLRSYFRTFGDQSIHMVEAVAAAKGEMRTIEMEGTTQSIDNASTTMPRRISSPGSRRGDRNRQRTQDRWPIACLKRRIYGQTIRQRPRRPRFQ
jgi:hypothetical protein